MKKGDLVLVYGTLRRGERADMTKKPNCTFIGVDKINGEMVNVGSFPGVYDVTPVELGGFCPNKPTITGELYMIHAESLSILLDNYEGYPSLYDRIQVSTETGLTAWVYIYPHDVSHLEPIPGGDWKKRSLGINEQEAA